MRRLLALILCLFFYIADVVSQSNNDAGVWVYTDVELFAAICAQKTLIWIGADLDLRERNWPQQCSAPVRYSNNLTISGPLNVGMNYTISFNFMARKIVIPPYGEVRLRHFTARNTRKGGGGEIDFIAYSPNGILWTDGLNKNQIICIRTTDIATLRNLPLPTNFSEFANKEQMVEVWDGYCSYGVSGRCWQEVLHYDQFYTKVNVGSDTETGGYVMAKRNSSKTCDEFVTADCIAQHGGEACIAAVINSFVASLESASPDTSSDSSDVNVLAIALPVALGGAALIAGVGVAVWWVRRRRRRPADAAAAAAASKLGDDVESGGAAAAAGGGGSAGRGGRTTMAHGSKGISGSSSGSGSKAGTSSLDELTEMNGAQQPPGAQDFGTAESFRYETNDDMGRCLSANRGAAAPSGSGAGTALVEGVMDDGSTCTLAVGSPLGQGSFGVVFKGTWKDKTVAVKLILCDKNYSEQVMNEVRLMTSEACRHPNLLRAYACMTRTRLLNKQSPGSQMLQSTIASLSSSARNRSGGSPAVVAAVAAASGKSSVGDGPELAETWIVSEYCDLGALAPHVHVGKKFLTYTDAADMFALTAIPSTASASTVPPPAEAPHSAAAEPPADSECPPAVGQPGLPTAARPPQHDPAPVPEQVPAAAPPASPWLTQSAQAAAAAAAASAAAAAAPRVPRRPRMAAILSCLRDIAAGMAHLHSLNVVHGDLKLANVLLCSAAAAAEGEEAATTTPAAQAAPEDARSSSDVTAPISMSLMQLPADMVAKVADFGLSRWLKEGQTHHSTKTVGTVTHMPPELLRSGRLTLSGDVYSFGIMMWELLTGSVPYKGLMYGEVVERVVVSHRRPEFPPHTPAAFRALAERCWAADSAARPTFAAVLAELETMVATAATLQAESDAVVLPAWQPSGPSVTLSTAAAAAAVAAVAGPEAANPSALRATAATVAAPSATANAGHAALSSNNVLAGGGARVVARGSGGGAASETAAGVAGGGGTATSGPGYDTSGSASVCGSGSAGSRV